MSVGSSIRGSCLVLLVVVLTTSWTVPPCRAASGPEIDAEVQSTLAEFFVKESDLGRLQDQPHRKVAAASPLTNTVRMLP
jgi:hypothetical protein